MIQIGLKLTKMGPNGPKRSQVFLKLQIVWIGPKLIKLSERSQRVQIFQNEPKLLEMNQNGPKWLQIDFRCVTNVDHLVAFGSICEYLWVFVSI